MPEAIYSMDSKENQIQKQMQQLGIELGTRSQQYPYIVRWPVPGISEFTPIISHLFLNCLPSYFSFLNYFLNYFSINFSNTYFSVIT